MEEADACLLDINTVTRDELEQVPGISRTKARLIIEQRNLLGTFSCIDDLLMISGITKSKLNLLKTRLTCSVSVLSQSDLLGDNDDDLTLNSTIVGITDIRDAKSIVMKRKLMRAVPGDQRSVMSSPGKRRKSVDPSSREPDMELGGFKVNSGVPCCAVPSGTVRRRLNSQASEPPHDLQAWLDQFHGWSREERQLSLDALISGCDMSLVRHIMAKIEPHFQRDFISMLPKELALYVLSLLEPRDLCRAVLTCRYWRILAEDTVLWREKCKEYDMFDHCSEGSDVSEADSSFKKRFLRQHKIDLNWRCRPLRPPKLLRGHDDHVITCLQFDGVRIVSASDDNTLKVWSAETGNLIKTLVGHTGGVWSSQLKDNIVVSGSTDRTLRVWDADSGECVHVLNGHMSTVRCLSLHGQKVVSGSRDGTLRLWDIKSGECLKVLIGHAAAVRCVQYDGVRVVSGAYDYLVKIWDPDSETCLHTLSGHSNRVYSLQFDGTYVVSGSLDTSIRVWDVNSGALLHTLLGHQSLTSGMVLKDSYLVSGNADSTVKVWDIVTGKCLHTLSGASKHQSAVTSLQFGSKFVVTSSDDGTVKLWDMKTGDFVRNLVVLESGGSGGVVWRVKCSNKKLVCAVGSRNGTEETKLMVLDFDVYDS